MLKLKELRLSGIGRFVDEQVINFDCLGNLVQVDGENKNTGGSSGAGKSTIFNSLDYLFGLSKIPNTVLKSRLTDSGISVSGTFDLDGKKLIISRGKKLSIDIDGEMTTGSAAITEEKLDEIIAIPRDLFRKMLHKRQKEGGFFLQMTPSEIDKFLTGCLGLGDFKQKIEIVDKKAKELQEKSLTLNGALESSKSALMATVDAKSTLLAPEKNVCQETIITLKGKYEQSALVHNELIVRHRAELDSLEISRPQIDSFKYDANLSEVYAKDLKEVRRQGAELISAEYAKQEVIKSEISSLKMQQMGLNAEIALSKSKQIEAAKIAIEIKKIRDSMCPTCEQTWVTENAKTVEVKLMENLKLCKMAIDAGSKASDSLQAIIPQICALSAQTAVGPKPEGFDALSSREVELNTLLADEKRKEDSLRNEHHLSNKSKLDEFASLQRIIREKHAVEMSSARGQAELDRRTFESAANALKSYEDARNRHDRAVQLLNTQEATYSSKVSELTKTSTEMHNALAISEELKRALKSYLSCSFDDALEAISENATKLIRHIPNMANATIQLDGTKETKDGKVKEEVNAVIHMDGEENIDIRSLSGGERTSADLAIDLSVLEIIEDRANSGINVFILDEPFTGQDQVNIEMTLEMLQNINKNKTLIIVDHNDAVKEFCQDKITVVRDGEISRIVQA